MNLSEYASKKIGFIQGHRSCSGCAMPIVARSVMSQISDGKVVVSNATGCMEVTSTIYPQSSWDVPYIHNTFENAAATISGVETAFKALFKKGKIKDKYKFIAFGGDGGTYDIGLQSLSGALERGHDFTYVCYDNQGYMNTGGQRSGSTPMGANTSTAPAGKVKQGKAEWKKDLVRICAAHNIPYVAQASVSNWADLLSKAKKAVETKGPSVLVVLSPCVFLWKIDSSKTIEVGRLAYETCFWPLYEIENGEYKLNYDPKDKKKPIEEFFKLQGRFKHLLLPENAELLKEIQGHIDKDWERLKRLSGQ